mmetsp:Transcript_148618/g.259746  ORF Transcript_148618/g.259746 Transcript_148618/m.259746 type:complete len:207 (+) Transcript_148618:648-1268(+)
MADSWFFKVSRTATGPVDPSTRLMVMFTCPYCLSHSSRMQSGELRNITQPSSVCRGWAMTTSRFTEGGHRSLRGTRRSGFRVGCAKSPALTATGRGQWYWDITSRSKGRVSVWAPLRTVATFEEEPASALVMACSSASVTWTPRACRASSSASVSQSTLTDQKPPGRSSLRCFRPGLKGCAARKARSVARSASAKLPKCSSERLSR